MHSQVLKILIHEMMRPRSLIISESHARVARVSRMQYWIPPLMLGGARAEPVQRVVLGCGLQEVLRRTGAG